MSKTILFSNLEAELARANITRAEIAAKIGVSANTMSAKLSGRSEFDLAEMNKARVAIETITGQCYTLDYLFEKND